MAETATKFQIYSSPSSSSSARQVTPFWREKYEKDAKKYWDIFYKRHKDKFFKDRHYLDKEWGQYFQSTDGNKLVVLEVGCGVGNSIYPLLSTFPDIFVHACDFSPRAIDLVKSHRDFCNRIHAFVCDLTVDNLTEAVQPSSVDIVTMIFVLSAVSPDKMLVVLQNIKKILKPNGHVLFRDYASGDLAQERLTSKEQKISENFYVRGDGTRAYYFSDVFLTNLFLKSGFGVVEIDICNKEVQNRSLELVMNRRWIQAVFTIQAPLSQGSHVILRNQQYLLPKVPNDDDDIDFSESIAEMFGSSSSVYEVSEVKVKDYIFRIKTLSKVHQHTYKSTGLMLWESAQLMCNILAENPCITARKRVLELGCGSAGIISMVAVKSAKLVVATDGDTETLDLLKENIAANLVHGLNEKVVVKRLIWGNPTDIEAVNDLSNCKGFEIIIGSDVAYNSDAIAPLFETASELISKRGDEETPPALILCHIQRRVHEDTILSTASRYGFELVDTWTPGTSSNSGIISSWFSQMSISDSTLSTTNLRILRFRW